ncbi:MAG: tol-pal system protein YbgF [Rubellimicrobium sp.]|nr:tol-pal system protein YbgF [Rubellimicrobium sp.]
MRALHLDAVRAALFGALVGGGLVLAPMAHAQDQTLADIRQELSGLYITIQSLRNELTATGTLTTGVPGATPLDRLNLIEMELQRLTSRTEELEFRINRITVDGTNRLGDLEFRICEMDPGCDIGSLGSTPSLGGVDNVSVVPTPDLPTTSTGPALAANEQADFARAQEALAQGDFRSAADQFAAFVQTYPGGPLSAEALFLRGQALEAMGEISEAARAYLDSFSGDPGAVIAPDALVRLGMALGTLGQRSDACVTLNEVMVRYPSAAAVGIAREAMSSLGCS